MNFILRPWHSNDLESLIKFGNNTSIAKFMTDQFPNPYTPEKARQFIEMATKNTPTNIMAIEIEGLASGGIGLHLQSDIQHKNAELGYWLGEPFWGNGIITNAIQQMVVYGFKTWDINRIFARPFGTNIGSQKALEKAGFKLEAKFERTFLKNGEYLDELVYAIRK